MEVPHHLLQLFAETNELPHSRSMFVVEYRLGILFDFGLPQLGDLKAAALHRLLVLY